MKKKNAYFKRGLVVFSIGIGMYVGGALLAWLLPIPWENRLAFTFLMWMSMPLMGIGWHDIFESPEVNLESK